MKIGIDTGFGHTKYALYSNEKSYKLGKFPSVVAINDGDKEDKNSNVHIFDNKLYYVGDTALKQDPNNIKEIVTYDTLEQYAPILIAEIARMEKLNLKDIESIGLGLSPSHKDNITRFKKRTQKFEINHQNYEFKNVSIIPQGFGAVCAMKEFWKNRKMHEPNDYITIDIGFNTMDIILVYDKEIQKDRINKDNSFENKGVIRIAKIIQKHIKKEFKKEITLKESLAIFLLKQYKLRGETYPLDELIVQVQLDYTKEIMEFLEQKYSNEFDKLDSVCFIGGGGYFIDKKYAKHIQTFENSEYYNAIGNLLIQ